MVFVGAGVALYVLVHARLLSDLNSSLLNEAQTIAGSFERSANGKLDLGLDQWSSNNLNSHWGHDYFQIWSARGRVLAKSPSLGAHDLLTSPRLFASPTDMSLTLPGDRDAIAVGLTVTPSEAHRARASGDSRVKAARSATGGQQSPVTLVVAHGMDTINDTLGDLGILLLLIWMAAIVIEVSVLAWVVRRGLRPTTALANQVARIDVTDLSLRVRLWQVPSELMPVVEKVNDLLDRIEAALTREKAFLGQVAHELRTPLAGLRSTLEVALSRPRDAMAYRQDLKQSLEISGSMQTMVDNLLTLARLDADPTQAHHKQVRVDQLLAECRRSHADPTTSKELHVDWQVAEAFAWTDEQRLRIILRNLMENAVTYAEAGGWIRIASRMQDGETVVQFTNSGCQVAAVDVHRVFERFWRGDPARTGDGSHCGLGLALCKQIIERSGGTIAVRCERGGTFEVTMKLPSSAIDSPITVGGQP